MNNKIWVFSLLYVTQRQNKRLIDNNNLNFIKVLAFQATGENEEVYFRQHRAEVDNQVVGTLYINTVNCNTTLTKLPFYKD